MTCRALPAVLLAAALLVGCSAETAEDVAGGADVAVVYEQPGDEEDEQVRAELREAGLVDDLVRSVDAAYDLPAPVRVLLAAGEPDPSYDPETREITLQYSFVDQVAQELSSDGETGPDDARSGALDVVAFVLLHELGHALVDVLDLPVTGREEDAVDGLATVLLVEHVEDGAQVAVRAAEWFAVTADLYGDEVDESAFAGEHSLDLQRAYATLCLAAGLDDGVHEQVEQSQLLEPERLERCPADAEQQARSWEALLEPARS